MRFNRKLSPVVNADLVPMIDVVFQLVVFFMVSSTFILTPGINIVLPDSSTSQPVAVSKVVVTIESDKSIYLNKERYNIKTLSRALSGMAGKEKGIKTVLVEGDKRIDYSLLVNVLDVLRRNGFKGINLKMLESK